MPMHTPSLMTPTDLTAARARLCDALNRLDQVEQQAGAAARAEALGQVATAYREMGGWREAEWSLKQALSLALALGAPDLAVDLQCELAEVTRALAGEAREQGDEGAARAALERCRDHCYAAVAQARHVADPHWEVRVLVRVAEVLEHCGDRHDALALQCRALDMMCRQEAGVCTPAAQLTAPQPLM
ncbi:hypothetical protein [Aquabacterium sp. J223]|uniref:hypothetical protein n=1 Tax=Aquabacterium sp. J223 TaxID=2898431 RepID=UPI0021ADCCF2|nr:hypothetical protein [Aquabacterium sp. J223]UUX95802.1 hypothetical protein LRS07_00090 [Aquabacterium sp. J223]